MISGDFIDIATNNNDKEKGFIQFFFYRPIAIIFSKLLIKNFKEISPNFITILGLLIGIISFLILISSNTRFFLIFGIILWVVSKIFDFIDGNIARYCNKKTYLGKFLDGFVDVINKVLLLIGLGFYLGNFFLVFSFITSIFYIMSNFIIFRYNTFFKLIDKKNINQSTSIIKKKNFSFFVKLILNLLEYFYYNFFIIFLLFFAAIEKLNIYLLIFYSILNIVSLLNISSRIFLGFQRLNILR